MSIMSLKHYIMAPYNRSFKQTYGNWALSDSL